MVKYPMMVRMDFGSRAYVVKCLFAKPAFDHGMMKKGYLQLHQIYR
jgi:hypothetical protein